MIFPKMEGWYLLRKQGHTYHELDWARRMVRLSLPISWPRRMVGLSLDMSLVLEG